MIVVYQLRQLTFYLTKPQTDFLFDFVSTQKQCKKRLLQKWTYADEYR